MKRKVYIVAKIFDKQGCIAYCCKNLSEANYVPNTLNCLVLINLYQQSIKTK